MLQPDVIILNGTASSGKSALAASLRRRLAEPYLHVQVDSFTDMLDLSHPKVTAKWWETPYLGRVLRGYIASLKALVEAGNRVIADTIVAGGEGAEMMHYVEGLGDLDVMLVAVRCDPAILDSRARARGRDVQIARSQGLVHVHGRYDVEVDTTNVSGEQCAELIIRRLEEDRPLKAFALLRREGPLVPPPALLGDAAIPDQPSRLIRRISG